MVVEVWWNCLFVQPDNTIRFGLIRQSEGKSLAKQIQSYQARFGSPNRRVHMILRSDDGTLIHFTDILYHECWVEVPDEDGS